MLKLIDLKPNFEKHGEYTHLAFDCPVCKEHRIVIPVKDHPKAWGMSGETFDELSITPSIAHTSSTGCVSHFFVTNGNIRIV